MILSPRRKIYLFLAVGIFLIHLVVACLAKPTFALTMFGDTLPCLLLALGILSNAENFRIQRGVLPLFWKLCAAGLFTMLLSQTYWFYYDSLRRFGTPSPVVGDCLFLLAHVFFIFALALRPHSMSAGRDLRIRRLDFALLTLWWFTLYCYFAFPWQALLWDLSKYNPAYYFLAFVQHLLLFAALATLAVRKRGAWRGFYLQLMFAFMLIGVGNLLLNVSIDRGTYYAGSFYDTPFFLSLVWFVIAGCYGPALRPVEESRPDRELRQSVYTARIAMLAILSLPVLGLLGFFAFPVPTSVADFRLRLIFAAMILLGALAFWKLNLLARELVHLVNLTQASIENLKSVQSRITHSQKFAALGRLAAGATHEISNPLTAILGYSELLADLPSLSTADRESAQVIQQQVHRAQAAVNSLRNTLRTPPPPDLIVIDKKPDP